MTSTAEHSDDHIPDGAELVRTTGEFTDVSVPRGLLRAHRVADGVWGNLVVIEGTVTFIFEDEQGAPRSVRTGETFAIPPGRPHHVEPALGARFQVEFYRLSTS